MTPYETILSQVAWTETPRGVLRVQGADARKWLHKIVAANAEQLETGRGAYSALLDAKGHFVADFILLRDGDLYGLLCESGARKNLFQSLKRYIIRDKVTFQDVTAEWECIVIVGNAAEQIIERSLNARAPQDAYAWTWGEIADTRARIVRDPRALAPSFDVMVPHKVAHVLRDALQNIPQVSAQQLEMLRVEAGLPKWGVDFDDTTLALEIPDVMQIRVDQGCYIGQEVVARIVHRGHVNRHLRGLKIENDILPARGDVIRFNDAQVGNVTSSAHSPKFGNLALGFVRREVELDTMVQINDANARVMQLPFSLL